VLFEIFYYLHLQHVEELAREMPLFKKLAHPALKTRHWKEIFAGMGESYEPSWTLLVDDLLSLDLLQHIQLINKVSKKVYFTILAVIFPEFGFINLSLLFMWYLPNTHLFVKVPLPGDNEETFSVVESSCHLLLPV